MVQAPSIDADGLLRRLREAPLLQEPFPHMYVEGLLPAAVYAQVLAAIPGAAAFSKVVYPGVGRGAPALQARGHREKIEDHGLALPQSGQASALAELTGFFAGDGFRDTLLGRFSAADSWPGHGPAIPPFKHVHFEDGAADVTTVFDIHKDLPGFELSPHRDVDEKVLTFLYYLEPDDLLADWGTLLCRPKPGLSYEDVEASPGTPGRPHAKDWALFDVTKTARAAPNNLLVFAPNRASFHAVRFDVPEDFPRRERTVLRGFVRSGRNQRNFIVPAADGG